MFRVDRAMFNAIMMRKIHPRIRRTMPRRAKARGTALPPKLMLACTLRYLAGGSYLDITLGWQVSRWDGACARVRARARTIAPALTLASRACSDSTRVAGRHSIARSTTSWTPSMRSTRSTSTPQTRSSSRRSRPIGDSARATPFSASSEPSMASRSRFDVAELLEVGLGAAELVEVGLVLAGRLALVLELGVVGLGTCCSDS